MGLREADPWKIRSSIRLPRRLLALCSPSAQRTASEMLLLPQPLGPTMPVIPGRMRTIVFSAKDLKPFRTMCSRRITLQTRKRCASGITRVREPPRKNHYRSGLAPAATLDAGLALAEGGYLP